MYFTSSLSLKEYSNVLMIKISVLGQAWWLTTLILDTVEAKIRRTVVRSQSRSKKFLRPHLNQ
jgi:hypothetical protein